MINAISAADIAFIMSSSTSAWLLSPLECSPQKQNGRTFRFCFWGWIMRKMYNKTIIDFGFRMISWIIKTSCLCYLPQPLASANNTDLGFDNSWYHAQPHPIIVYYSFKIFRPSQRSFAITLFVFPLTKYNTTLSPGFLGQRFNNLRRGCTFDVIDSIWRRFFPNLVNSSWLWWIVRVVLTNQKGENILNE